VSGLYGLLAEVPSAEALVRAARAARDAGYRRMDAFSPLPVEGLAEALGRGRTRLPFLVLLGGILGAASGYGMQYWISAVAYPVDVGGRGTNSWPAFVPVTFEMTILFAAIFAVVGMLARNGLPQPYHPVFNVPEFALASRDAFFLCIEAKDEAFDAGRTRQFLESLGARRIHDVRP
jgi:hypothetical protein